MRKITRILFICTGNTCRSPMAEAILRQVAGESKLAIEVKSAGISAMNGGGISRNAIHILKDRGIASEHSSQRIHTDIVDWADIILTMTMHHKYAVIHQFSQSIDKVFSLNEYIHRDPEIEHVQRELDRLYVEKESMRVEMKNRYSSNEDSIWLERSKKAYNIEMKALQEKEEKLLYRLQNILSHQDIQDPFGGDVEEYGLCAAEIEQGIRRLVQILSGEDK